LHTSSALSVVVLAESTFSISIPVRTRLNWRTPHPPQSIACYLSSNLVICISDLKSLCFDRTSFLFSPFLVRSLATNTRPNRHWQCPDHIRSHEQAQPETPTHLDTRPKDRRSIGHHSEGSKHDEDSGILACAVVRDLTVCHDTGHGAVHADVGAGDDLEGLWLQPGKWVA